MTNSEEVAQNLFNELVGERIDQYKDDLANGDPENSLKLYSQAMEVFQKLTPQEQQAIINFLKIVSIDAVSILLSAFAGVSDLGQLSGEFVVSYEGEKIHYDMQDDFFEIVEREGLLAK